MMFKRDDLVTFKEPQTAAWGQGPLIVTHSVGIHSIQIRCADDVMCWVDPEDLERYRPPLEQLAECAE